MYDHNSRGHIYRYLIAHINDEICWPLFLFKILSYHFLDIITRHSTKTAVLSGDFDRIAMKFGMISICTVALSCYACLPLEDDGEHLGSCVSRMPNNVPSTSVKCRISYPAGRSLVKFKATGQNYVEKTLQRSMKSSCLISFISKDALLLVVLCLFLKTCINIMVEICIFSPDDEHDTNSLLCFPQLISTYVAKVTRQN